MKEIFIGNQLYLLQDMKYFKDDDPVGAMILLIGIVSIVVISLVVHFIRNGIGNTGMSKGSRTAVTPRKFNSFTLHRVAASYGLDKDQSRLLEYVFRSDAVNDIERVMKNSALLDKHFKRTYKTIEKNAATEEEVQQRMARLFSLRNVIEAAPVNAGGVSSTTNVPENTPAVLSNGKESYPVRVLSARGPSLVIENPRNALGTIVRVPKGAKVSLSFFTKSSKGFAFESRVLGTIETPHGHGLELAHSGKPKPLVHRRFRRRQTNASCVFFLVFLDNSKANRKQPPKLVVDNRRFTGTILDISAGGCSIKTSAPVQVGTRLKIEIDYSDEALITVLGQVLRTNRSGAVGTIVHVKFLKVPRRAYNNINALVFGYDEE